MNPNGPWTGPGDMPAGGAPAFVHHDAWWAGPLHLLPLLLLAVLIGVLVWGVLRMTSQGALTIAGAPTRDQALDALRVRYARREVDRTDYLERSADLGGSPIADEPAHPPLPGEPRPDQE